MIKAIIWDYDGTLVDTRRKNLEVTREIMQEVVGEALDTYKVLQSLDYYQSANENSKNWRELYKTYFQLSDAQINKAGAMWKEYQVKNETEVSLFKNIRHVLNELNEYPHGIVSQNAYDNIVSSLTTQKIQSLFSKVIGYEEVSYDQQKPDPTGLLACIKHLTDFNEGLVVYIGDHETDIQCAYLANNRLKEAGKNLQVISIAALYGLSTDTESWRYKPDFEACDTSDICLTIRELAT